MKKMILSCAIAVVIAGTVHAAADFKAAIEGRRKSVAGTSEDAPPSRLIALTPRQEAAKPGYQPRVPGGSAFTTGRAASMLERAKQPSSGSLVSPSSSSDGSWD